MANEHLLERIRAGYREVEHEEWLEHGYLKDQYLLDWYRATFYEPEGWTPEDPNSDEFRF